MLTEMVQRTRLEHAAGHVMWCECGRLLDCRRIVLVTTGATTGVTCGECFDISTPPEPTDERQMTLPGMGSPPPTEILDGRKIQWPDAEGPAFGLPGMTDWTDPVTGNVERFETPSETALEHWFMDTMCEALDGCDIESDGTCRHGYPSWLSVLGFV